MYENLFRLNQLYAWLLCTDGVGKAGMYADGKPHQLLYKRSNSEMILTVCIEVLSKYWGKL